MRKKLSSILLVLICTSTLALSGCLELDENVLQPSDSNALSGTVTTEGNEEGNIQEDVSNDGTSPAITPSNEDPTEPVTETPTETPTATQPITTAPTEPHTEPQIGNYPNGFTLAAVPAYTNSPYAVVNGNTPFFIDAEITADSYEYYSELDSLGRCYVTMACIGKDLMPTEERGEIGQVKPTGWHTVKYDCIDGNYLYNRCHLIGFQLTGENANTKNLITGTRYMNVDGMLPFENMVDDYIEETSNHVLFRVTPIFEGSNLVASGVLMEAISVEDNGEGILFCVFCYNAQPGVAIDYATGESSLKAEEETEELYLTARHILSTQIQRNSTIQAVVAQIELANQIKVSIPAAGTN